MKIVLATAKAPHNRRVEFAMSTWDNAVAQIVEVECARTSAELGDDRGYYFFKDVYDYALKLNPDDIFVYANNDVALVPGWSQIIVNAVQAHGCTYSRRVEVNEFAERLTLDQLTGSIHEGQDIFAFTPAWWKQVRDSLPDLLLGYEGYDFVVCGTINKTGGQESRPICYHEKHLPAWRTVTSDHPARIRECNLFQKWINEKTRDGWRFDYRPYGVFAATEDEEARRSKNLSTSAGRQQKNLSTSAES